MISANPISPLLALSRVDYLESSMLCVKVSATISRIHSGHVPDSKLIDSFRCFLPEFLGVDTLQDATYETVLPVALLAVAPALHEAGIVSEQERSVTSYLDALRDIDSDLSKVLSEAELDIMRLSRIEKFSRSLSSHMTSAAEQAIREGQSMPL